MSIAARGVRRLTAALISVDRRLTGLDRAVLAGMLKFLQSGVR
jgi:hypothetical protein